VLLQFEVDVIFVNSNARGAFEREQARELYDFLWKYIHIPNFPPVSHWAVTPIMTIVKSLEHLNVAVDLLIPNKSACRTCLTKGWLISFTLTLSRVVLCVCLVSDVPVIMSAVRSSTVNRY
jgi:hypothetical protein